jgi:hypothetical protein
MERGSREGEEREAKDIGGMRNGNKERRRLEGRGMGVKGRERRG